MKPPKRINLTPEQIEALLGRMKAALSDGDYRIIKAIVDTYIFLHRILEQKTTSIKRLRQMIFGSKSEKTKDVLKDADNPETGNPSDSSDTNEDASKEEGGENKKKRKGHGRNGADQYTGATQVEVPHPELKAKDLCPDCRRGKVYESLPPETVVLVEGKAPVQATVYRLQNLRCNLCGEVFSAPRPGKSGSPKTEQSTSVKGQTTEKLGEPTVPQTEKTRFPKKKKSSRIYDNTVGSVIALLKYGAGFPFYRLGKLQAALGVPLPPSTQWDIVEKTADRIYPVYEELKLQGAQGNLLHNDDTVTKILERMKYLDKRQDKKQGDRTGTFTSAILSIKDQKQIALFYTGEKHAGENMADLLGQRGKELSPPIQMCDALSRNSPKGFKTILANCLSHGRRKFVEVAWNFPQPCRDVLEMLKEVYINDDITKKQAMSAQERLRFHQKKSGPLMEKLKTYLLRLLDEKKVEPNSGMGQAASYMFKHWEPLTLFLKVPGAPLDNNICERAIKKVIQHRKNSLFYKTEFGATIGDMFMSLIHTCCLNGVNPFHYLTELQIHSSKLFKAPGDWMPWNYETTLSSMPH